MKETHRVSYKSRKKSQTVIQCCENLENEMKSDQLAVSFITEAKECFSLKKYSEALKKYNESLRFAVTKSQTLSEAYAGRSRVYYEAKQYEKCLDNIQSAIDANVCDEKFQSLKTFQNKCRIESLASKNDDKDTCDFFTLTQPVHKKIPFIAECLEVRENDVYGRYIMTTKNLIPGDIVVVEEPFYKVLDPEQRHTRCAICLQQNFMDLIPCTKCSNGESVSR